MIDAIERLAAKLSTGEVLTDVRRYLKRAHCARGGHAEVRYLHAPDAYVCRCGKSLVWAEDRRGW